MSRTRTGLVIGALVAILLLSLIDINALSTAAPEIGRSFGAGAIAQVPWLVVAYALAETVAQPLYGRLTDRHGPRPVLLAALGLFGLGSLLCATASSMTELALLRTLQGLGAAGLLSVTFVLMGHLRAEAESDGAAGNVAAGAMLAFGLTVGPLLGGIVTEHLGWRWIFWLNLPFTAAAFGVLFALLRIETERSRERIDWPAAALLVAAAAALQAVCLGVGGDLTLPPGPLVAIGVAGAVCAAALIARERRTAHPFFPPFLLRDRTLRALSLLQLATGIGMAASAVYVALDLQILRGYSPLQAGAQTIPLAGGVLVGAAAGALLQRSGRSLRGSFVLANALCAAAFAVLALGASATVAVLWVALALLGTGVGLSLGNELLIVQAIVPAGRLGVATTGVRFVETLGTSAGAALFAVIFARSATRPGLTLIFTLGALTMLLAAWVAHRLPADISTSPSQPSHRPTHLQGAADEPLRRTFQGTAGRP